MTAPRTYWVGSMFVAEWTLRDTTGDPLTGATVTGEVRLPDGATAPMTVETVDNVYTATYQAAAAGTHGFALAASGTGVDAYEGTFIVGRSQVGAPPITLDPTADIGMIRLLITDTNEIEPLFEDPQIDAFLSIEGGIKKAAALGLETVAVSEVLISKKLRTSDGLTTDGPAVAAELRARAKALRDQAATELDEGADFGFDVIDFDPYAAYRR
ncbi:hypothetical protein AB0B94_30675 [Micromonospora sp. NPDC048986]|uniref:hypothetical protein n=1 Tax=Micromonospora sp. NPDC048986 TaxID=3155644 RepID=UPI0033F995F3